MSLVYAPSVDISTSSEETPAHVLPEPARGVARAGAGGEAWGASWLDVQ